MGYDLERIVLKTFFYDMSNVEALDNSISDSKVLRTTQNKLKAALKNEERKCTCARRSWGGPCELCQESDKELYALRNFFNVIRNAKKHGTPPEEIQAFIQNTKADIK